MTTLYECDYCGEVRDEKAFEGLGEQTGQIHLCPRCEQLLNHCINGRGEMKKTE